MELFEIIALIMIGVFLIGMRMFMCDPFEEQNRKTLHRRLISSYKSYLHEKLLVY